MLTLFNRASLIKEKNHQSFKRRNRVNQTRIRYNLLISQRLQQFFKIAIQVQNYELQMYLYYIHKLTPTDISVVRVFHSYKYKFYCTFNICSKYIIKSKEIKTTNTYNFFFLLSYLLGTHPNQISTIGQEDPNYVDLPLPVEKLQVVLNEASNYKR